MSTHVAPRELKICRNSQPCVLVEIVPHRYSRSIDVVVNEERKSQNLQGMILQCNEWYSEEDERWHKRGNELIGQYCVLESMAGHEVSQDPTVMWVEESQIVTLMSRRVEEVRSRNLDRDPVKGEPWK